MLEKAIITVVDIYGYIDAIRQRPTYIPNAFNYQQEYK